ncbi:MAG: DNA-3-methyladenine glycosylase 2 family protein [Saprospiraceae bacterium]|nr:DNA-3-methyladenine glycosylase 2 family protein [Saprospiraceae bacterium]
MHPNILNHLKTDTKIAVLIDNTPLYLEYRDVNVFDQLIRSVVSQQLSTTAASTIYNRFLSILNQNMPVQESVLSLQHEALRAVGLSSQKAQYIKNIAAFFQENDLFDTDWENMSDHEIIHLLTKIKGVGIWTVQMLLMFTLKREDVFPIDDLVIRNSMIELYDVKSKKKQLIEELHIIADPWSPYRSIACRYLWAAKDQIKQISSNKQ